ncbi:MAG: hypothetical protein M0Z71_02405 [Nitrospiraceae bacterium]|nr:hypothetical protein [Nitrospiraceae bacterium]
MKLRRLLILSVLLACLVVSSPALALPIFDLPIDPIEILPPILTLDPCLGASFIADMGTQIAMDSASGTGFFTAVYKYDLLRSGTTVAHMITTYSRIDFGAVSHVAMEDTLIVDPPASITVFGRSVNVNATGLIGSHGIIVAAVNRNGTAATNIKGRYLITDFGGTNRFCAFLE